MGSGSPTSAGTMSSVNRGFLIASLAAVVIGLLMSLVLAREVSRPISDLTVAVHGVAGGDYSQRVVASGGREIHELGDTFNRLSENLETNEMLRHNLVADISHELRNPLASIKASVEAAEDGVTAVGPDYLRSLSEDVDVLTRLVDDLHQLNQLEAGEVALKPAELLIGSALESAASRLSSEAGYLEIVTEIESDLPPVWADPQRLSQILSNLTGNAVAHTPPGGKVTLGARRCPTESMVEVFVSDTGSGIAPEDLPYIFERLYRAEPARERATGGAGIGLAVVRSLVESGGGRIWAESRLQSGTTITFTLPVRKDQEAS